ncbi:MAG TPA: hypothetical protein ENK18_03075 [Deltaproteobacteria bacterium]|nr:hypothetical protein [Deltaproteobacteria bacterium]
MRGTIWIITAVPIVGSLLACSGVSLPLSLRVSYDNVTPCQAYVDAYNALECVPEHKALSREDNCGPSLDLYPCDLAEHYSCLSAGLACEGGQVDVSGQSVCGDRSCD